MEIPERAPEEQRTVLKKLGRLEIMYEAVKQKYSLHIIRVKRKLKKKKLGNWGR